ncbi:hypothetical protein ACLOJK_021130 [Asimina triloba]
MQCRPLFHSRKSSFVLVLHRGWCVEMNDASDDFVSGVSDLHPPANDHNPGGSEEDSQQQVDNSSIPEPTWMDSLRHKILSNPPTEGSKLDRVSYCLWRMDGDDASRPEVVCLGRLRLYYSIMLDAVEEQKWSYLQEALSAVPGGAGLDTFLGAVKDLEQTARNRYLDPFDRIGRNDFIEMLLLDGCFIVQLLLKETHRLPIRSDDLIFQKRWLFHTVQKDLLLLKNQFPFFVLDRLFGLIASSEQGLIGVSLRTVVQEFFKDKIEAGRTPAVDNPKHLLHVLHSNLFPDIDGRKLKASSVANLKPIPGATQLLAAGVELGSGSADHDRSGIAFDDGLLRIPHLSIDDDTKSLFSNLIAFEQSDPQCDARVTAYAFFMDGLINAAEDVAVLCGKGIIDNCLGSHQQVADLFNQLGRRIIIYPDELYLADVIDRINAYCSIRRTAKPADFKHKRFHKLQAIFFLTAAVILLILTSFLQTFFAVLTYFHPPS